jgi:hypothetical protein
LDGNNGEYTQSRRGKGLAFIRLLSLLKIDARPFIVHESEIYIIDLDEGRVAYAVLSFGGFMGMGNKLFAIPWEALTVDTVNKEIVLNVQKEVLENAPGFDKDNRPQMSDRQWLVDVYSYYGYDPYW